MVLAHIPQEFSFSAGFIWVIAGEQLALIKWNAEDLVNDFSPFFSHVLWDNGKQTVTRFCAKGPGSLPQLPGAEMALINCSALNWNCAECIYTADACRNPLSKECDISGGEWQSSREKLANTCLSCQLFTRPLLCSLQNANGSTVAWRVPCTTNLQSLGWF